jgi:hypothetical protein
MKRSLESWIIIVNPKLFFNDIQENNIIKKLINFKKFFMLNEIIKEYFKLYLYKFHIEIHKKNNPIN